MALEISLLGLVNECLYNKKKRGFYKAVSSLIALPSVLASIKSVVLISYQKQHQTAWFNIN